MLTQPTLGFVLNDVARLLRKRFEQRARDLGLTRAQWQTLAYLSRMEGIHQAGLAEQLEIEPITLVRIIDRLEARGLVERRRHDADRRVWMLHLTETAHPVLEEIRHIGADTRVEALAGIGEEDRVKFFDILTLMKANLAEACRQPVETKEISHG